MEKNMKKNICITESLCYEAEINNIVNQLYFNKILRKGKIILLALKIMNLLQLCIIILSL